MKTLYIMLFFFMTSFIFGQNLSVIHIDGSAFYVTQQDGKEKYNKMTYGPITDASSIIVKENSSIKLLRDDNKISAIEKEGTYLLKDLTFITPENTSMFGKFCDYFHSFFVNHSSAESKANYHNNIYAISRGNTPAPSLDFPLEGRIPVDAGPLTFIWTHACDSCEYIFTIADLSSKDIVYTLMTTDQTVTIRNPEKYLTSGNQYYWSTRVVGLDLEYENVAFSAAADGQYMKAIKSIESSLNESNVKLSPTPKLIYVLSELENNDELNFALFYGLNQKSIDNSEESLSDVFDRYWYDHLLNK